MENIENLERAGAILTLIGVIWIAVLAFQAGDVLWGIFCLICPVLVALIYGFLNFQRTTAPVILIIVGLVLGGAKLTHNVLF